MIVYTLNARSNIFLECFQDYFNLPPEKMLNTIQSIRNDFINELVQKNIKYTDLRAVLVPSHEKREIALVFDSSKIKESWYGYKIFECIMPLIGLKQEKHSILCGDYIGDNQLLHEAFFQSVVLHEEIEYRHSSQFYIVYINNLTNASFEKLHTSLINSTFFVGYADVTYSSKFKIILSTILVNLCIKYGKNIIQGHLDDETNNQNINSNPSGLPFEKSGYNCVSISSYLFGIFLSYKIERPIVYELDRDSQISINAVNSRVLPLDDFSIQIDLEKLEYIKNKNINVIEYIDEIDESLQKEIRKKILSNYVYEMDYDSKYGLTKFNIMIELSKKCGKKRKFKIVFEYKPDFNILKMITMY